MIRTTILATTLVLATGPLFAQGFTPEQPECIAPANPGAG